MTGAFAVNGQFDVLAGGQLKGLSCLIRGSFTQLLGPAVAGSNRLFALRRGAVPDR